VIIAAGVVSIGFTDVVVEDEADGIVEAPRPPQTMPAVNYPVSYSLIPCSLPPEKFENSVNRLDVG